MIPSLWYGNLFSFYDTWNSPLVFLYMSYTLKRNNERTARARDLRFSALERGWNSTHTFFHFRISSRGLISSQKRLEGEQLSLYSIPLKIALGQAGSGLGLGFGLGYVDFVPMMTQDDTRHFTNASSVLFVYEKSLTPTQISKTESRQRIDSYLNISDYV